VRSCASAFNYQYPLFPRGLAIAAYVFFLVFPSLLFFLQSRFRKGIHWAFLLFLVCRILFLPWLYAIFHLSHYRRNWARLPTAPNVKVFSVFLTYFPDMSKLQHQENLSNWKDSVCGYGVTKNLLSLIIKEMQSSVHSSSEWNVPRSEDSEAAILLLKHLVPTLKYWDSITHKNVLMFSTLPSILRIALNPLIWFCTHCKNCYIL